MSQHLQNTTSPEKNQAVRLRQAPAAAGCPGERSDLPCLYSNNSTETSETNSESAHKLEQIQALSGILKPYYKKAAHILYANTDRLISQAKSVNHVGFLTLTFPDNVTDAKDAYKRFHSFNTNYLKPSPDYGEWISAKERQKRGAWHYHLLIQTAHDIRTGINFEELASGNYSSANASLKSLWKSNREALPKYGLGRSELLPIRTNQEAMARYLGKYISKHIGCRTAQDRGVRLVNYSRNWPKNSIRFSWNTDNAKEWRRKVALFAEFSGCQNTQGLSRRWGPNWAYTCLELIINIDKTNEAYEDHQDRLAWIKENIPF